MQDTITKIQETIRRYQLESTPVSDDTGLATYCMRSFNRETGQEHLLYLPDHHFSQPPLDLELRYGLSGIAGHYRFPSPLVAEDVQAYMQILDHRRMRGRISGDMLIERSEAVFAMLAFLNPDLEKLSFDRRSFVKFSDAIIGVASGISVRDIQFLLDGHTEKEIMKDNAYAAMHDELERRFFLGWLPSPETILDIGTQMHIVRKPAGARLSRVKIS